VRSAVFPNFVHPIIGFGFIVLRLRSSHVCFYVLAFICIVTLLIICLLKELFQTLQYLILCSFLFLIKSVLRGVLLD